MTRVEWLVALALIAVAWAVMHGLWLEHDNQQRTSREERTAGDEQTLWTLQRIVGALEVYSRDNHGFPYDSAGPDRALQRLWAGPEAPKKVRVEYANPAPGASRSEESIVLVATRPPEGQAGMAFFMTDLGAICQCPEEKIERLGLKTLAGATGETISRLGAANIDEANMP
jgi:predicted outer membrane lipoprotein